MGTCDASHPEGVLRGRRIRGEDMDAERAGSAGRSTVLDQDGPRAISEEDVADLRYAESYC